jgi:uncharacterized protein (DUF2236 family)
VSEIGELKVGDDGYFGPGSVSWAVLGQPLTMVGGLRALVLQALHPEAMVLMDAKTIFRDEPWARIRRTAQYVATVTYASTDVVDAAAARVRTIHKALGIGDPQQLAWVHACEVDSFLQSALRAGVRIDGQHITEAQADAFVSEQRVSGRLVGVPDDLMPANVAELAGYFDRIRPQLRLTREALRGVRYVVAPPMSMRVELLTPARLGWTTISTLAVGLLPRWARRMYHLPANAAGDVATTAALRTLSAAVGALPAKYRISPAPEAARARSELNDQVDGARRSSGSAAHGSSAGAAA